MATYYHFGLHRAHRIYFTDEGDETMYYFQAPTGETSDKFLASECADVEAEIRFEIDRWIKDLCADDFRAYLHYTILDLIETKRQLSKENNFSGEAQGKLTAYLDVLNRLYNWDREPVEESNAEIHIHKMLQCS